MNKHHLAQRLILTTAFLLIWSCGPIEDNDGPLTEGESKFIYSNTLYNINSAAAFFDGSKTVQCAPSGSYTLTGSVEGSSVDRTYDIDMKPSSCEMVAINPDNSRIELVINGGPVKGVKTADGGITLSGSFSWSASDGRSGSCTMTPATSACL